VRYVDLRNELLGEVASIAPVVAEHAMASEALGRLDAPTIAALRSTRLLHFLSPRELGGLEADPVTQVVVLESAGANRRLHELGTWYHRGGSRIYWGLPARCFGAAALR
jgi:hypothetical protein